MAGNNNSGRRALPAALHLIGGNKSKKSAAELAAAGMVPAAPIAPPTCPEFLTPDAKTEWKRIVGDLAVMGVLSRIDRAELAVYCQAWGDWKMARQKMTVLKDAGFEEITPSGYKQMSVWMQIANRAEDRMRTAGASFGLNPSARSRLQVQAPQAELFPNEQKEAANKFFGP
jgi:P27 family predicted phage terminase small subunit